MKKMNEKENNKRKNKRTIGWLFGMQILRHVIKDEL